MATIVFRVNLSTVNQLTDRQPYTGTCAAQARSTWFPDILRDNHSLHHGDTFTAYDMNALYLKNNFTSGTYKFLDIVSQTAP